MQPQAGDELGHLEVTVRLRRADAPVPCRGRLRLGELLLEDDGLISRHRARLAVRVPSEQAVALTCLLLPNGSRDCHMLVSRWHRALLDGRRLSAGGVHLVPSLPPAPSAQGNGPRQQDDHGRCQQAAELRR